MNAEDQIRNLKQIPPLSKDERKKKVRAAIVLTLATFISILFLVYAFVQKLEADKQKDIAVSAKLEAEQLREEAERMRIVAQYQEMQARKQAAAAEEALAQCKKSKKK